MTGGGICTDNANSPQKRIRVNGPSSRKEKWSGVASKNKPGLELKTRGKKDCHNLGTKEKVSVSKNRTGRRLGKKPKTRRGSSHS